MSAAAGEGGARASERAQRVRLRFARGPEARELGHLDMTGAWERALRDADIPVSYSQSKRAQARITLAAGLPSGVTSSGELIDLVLARPVRPAELIARTQPHLPAGLQIVEAWEVGVSSPSLPAAMRWADYEVDVAAGRAQTEDAVASFLALERLPWRDTRGERVREYDLRPLVQDLRVEGECGGLVRLVMRLRCDTSGVGRPAQVAQALGLEPARVHRRRLVLADASRAHEAWRRRGRFVE